MVLLGVLLHAIGGFAAGSFYIPLKKIRDWAWESGWFISGIFSWIIAPWIVASLAVPHLYDVLSGTSGSTLFWTYFFGVLWGIGGLTFGLSVRYLGLSLGYAVVLGFCAAFGTLIPPIYHGQFMAMIYAADGSLNVSGVMTLLGVVICLIGISICGSAGMVKEKTMTEAEKKKNIADFNLGKGVVVAVLSGVMSACMAFAFQAGAEIGKRAVDAGTDELYRNFPVLIIVLAGGMTTNGIWCLYMNFKNRTLGDYTKKSPVKFTNYVYAAAAGITWYLQFMFYGMGTTRMGAYDFSSWTLHMAFIIAFSNVWGLYFKEWQGAPRRAISLVVTGIMVLVLSTVVVGAGNYFASPAVH